MWPSGEESRLNPETILLAGDIGGTKTVLSLFPVNGRLDPIHSKTFPSKKYDSLEAVVNQFLQDQPHRPRYAAFGVAGPVMNGRSRITNLPWYIDTDTISKSCNIPHVQLLNDLESIANAVPYLPQEDLVSLNPGEPQAGGAIAVVAPGTGLGEAFLVWDGSRYRAYPSEGGHATFAPTNADQRAMLAFLESKMSHVSVERVCSGMGVPNLYEFWRESGRYEEPDWLRDALAAADDRTPIIFENGLARKAPICEATLNMFIDILASEVSNMALKVLATGGIYLGGGIPPRILPELQDGRFMTHFSDKGRFSNLVSQIPIHLIDNPAAALHGAAHFGRAMIAGVV